VQRADRGRNQPRHGAQRERAAARPRRPEGRARRPAEHGAVDPTPTIGARTRGVAPTSGSATRAVRAAEDGPDTDLMALRAGCHHDHALAVRSDPVRAAPSPVRDLEPRLATPAKYRDVAGQIAPGGRAQVVTALARRSDSRQRPR
jgi:hypothetical protein